VGEFLERKRSKKNINLTELGKLCNISIGTIKRFDNKLK